MKRIFKTFALLAFAAFTAISCGEKADPENKGISHEEQMRRNAAEKALAYLKNDIMADYYYWYHDMKNVAYTYQSDIYKFFDALLVPQDRWSWMMTAQEYLESETGEETGTYGVSLGQEVEYYHDYSIREDRKIFNFHCP